MSRHPKVVMAFGTFDLIHKGHLSYLKQARKKGDILVVSIARDENVKKIKGKKPLFSEQQRKSHMESLKIADKVVLGDRKDYMLHIKKVRPDVIVLGYDQKVYTDNLKSDLKEAGLQTKVFRARAHKPSVYKSSKLKEMKL